MRYGTKIPLLAVALTIVSLAWHVPANAGQGSQTAEFDPQRVIIKFKPQSRILAQNVSEKIPRLERITPLKLDAVSLTRPLPGGVERLFVAQISPDAAVSEVLKELAANPEVEYAEPDYIGHGDGSGPYPRMDGKRKALAPADPDFFWQWGLLNQGQLGGKPGIDVNAVPAWDITTGDSNTILAVIDTGLALNAPDFAGRILPGYDFVNNDTDPADDYGHGTNVTSVAAATGGNAIGIAGMNWKCRILPLKVLDSNDKGNYSWFASAFMYAAEHGARVINISAGGSGVSQALADAVAFAQAHGVIVVACMMNTNNETTYYPAGYSGVIAVGGLNNLGLRAVPFCYSVTSGSNYGSHIAFVAPGDAILGINYRDMERSSFWCGTSQATPFVSGLVTLMLAVNPELSRDQVFQALKAGARDQIGPSNEDSPGWDKYFGWGLIDAYRSLLEVANTSILFAQMAIGGGYSTIFTFVNTGSIPYSGNLLLIGDDGNAMSATLSSPGYEDTVASSFHVNINPGGTQFVTADMTGSGTKVGWARVIGSGGSLGGVATFRFMNGGQLSTIVGVHGSDPTNSASIPVDDDRTLGVKSRMTGYAVANPWSENINIRLLLARPDGSVFATLDPPPLNPLRPGRHVARFLWEDLNDPLLQFKGSMVLTAQGSKSFPVTALVLNQGLYTAIPVIPAYQAGGTANNVFAQVAIGGGYTTTCTLLNPGGAVVSGNLVLKGNDGTPLNALFSSPGMGNLVGSLIPISVSSGGTQFVQAAAVNPSDAVRSGWAHIEQASGLLGGVATFQLMNQDTLATIVGVLASGTTDTATIPIDDDCTLAARSRITGYAVANPGEENINVRIVLVNPDGTVAREISPQPLNPLLSGQHVAHFLWEDLADPNLRFKGSIVLIADSGKTFSVMALVLNQGLYTALPVISAKAPAIR